MTITRIDIEPVDGAQRFRVLWRGDVLLERARDPEHEAARALKALGIVGRVQSFYRGTPSLTLNIEAASQRTVIETASGLRSVRWQPLTADIRARMSVSDVAQYAETTKQTGALPASY